MRGRNGSSEVGSSFKEFYSKVGERRQRKGVEPGGEVNATQFCLCFVFKVREMIV